jgi:hypothetical protein
MTQTVPKKPTIINFIRVFGMDMQTMWVYKAGLHNLFYCKVLAQVGLSYLARIGLCY